MNIFYVMFTDENGCPALLHDPVIGEASSLLWCCCPAFAYQFSYADACLVAKVLKGEAVLAETYEGKLKAWSENYEKPV
jgi:hypothetical protein